MILTQAIFEGQPDWVNYAAIDKSGDVLGFKKDPNPHQDKHGWLVIPFVNESIVIDDSGAYNANTWRHSIIRRQR